jgi:hypothetical protein
MPKRPAGKKPLSGGAKMRAAGRVGILIAVTPAQHARFHAAARADGRTLSGWLRWIAECSSPKLEGGER